MTEHHSRDGWPSHTSTGGNAFDIMREQAAQHAVEHHPHWTVEKHGKIFRNGVHLATILDPEFQDFELEAEAKQIVALLNAHG
jgi:hypothetical protein